jgi:hypothetical protein
MVSEFLIHLLSIKGVLILSYYCPTSISNHFGLKDSIYILLILKEKLFGLINWRDLDWIKNLAYILTCLVHKRLMPIVIELFIFQCREKGGVPFNTSPEQFCRCVP